MSDGAYSPAQSALLASAEAAGAKHHRRETLARILKAAKTRPSIPLSVYAPEIRSAAVRHGLSDVRVFGSAVGGTDTEASDIDLVVATTADSTIFDIGGFSADVHALTGFDVDVLTDRQLDNAPFAHVRDESVPL